MDVVKIAQDTLLFFATLFIAWQTYLLRRNEETVVKPDIAYGYAASITVICFVQLWMGFLLSPMLQAVCSILWCQIGSRNEKRKNAP